MVQVDVALPQNKPPPPDAVQTAIGKNVASLVEDGATLQMGIGAIPDAVLSCLGNHKKLGNYDSLIRLKFVRNSHRDVF